MLNEWYATKIALEWNVPRAGVGYVLEFDVDAEYAARFPTQQVGGRDVLELWVPAENMGELNRHIWGGIREIVRSETAGDS